MHMQRSHSRKHEKAVQHTPILPNNSLQTKFESHHSPFHKHPLLLTKMGNAQRQGTGQKT
eukprot:14787708-Ditylum_brightwellii.AAC.1